ncbi:MAG: ATP-binding protein [Chloroflexi bacterium]|nr:ATP-binding protein [Chloroflexota bacterium]
MTEDDMDQLIARGHETRGVEFKGPGSRTDKLLGAKVTRAAIGMANRRDGGLVVVGVDDAGSSLTATGLVPVDVSSWQHDHVATMFANYADPSLQFEMEVLDYRGVKLVLLHVDEFHETPVLCKKQWQVSSQLLLREGALYVRSRRKPETTEVATSEDMRGLIELALEKGLRRWVSQARISGVLAPSTPPPPSDSARFQSELEGL